MKLCLIYNFAQHYRTDIFKLIFATPSEFLENFNQIESDRLKQVYISEEIDD